MPMDEVDEHRMPLLEHLVELRDRLMVIAIAVGVGMIVCFGFSDLIFAFLSAPIELALAEAGQEGIQGTLAIHSPFEGIYTYIAIAITSGFMLASPVVAWQVWSFIAPGLYASERRVVLPLSFASTTLFLAGAAFAYAVIFPIAFPFFLTVTGENVKPVLSIATYLGVVLRMVIAFGLCFQVPVVCYFLARIGLIDHRDLTNSFRYAVVVIFVIAALITPPDPITQLALALPLIVLYGIGIGVAWMATTKVRDAESS